MERTYSKGTTRRRSTVGSQGRSHSRRGVSLAPRERRRLIQLCVCAALFLTVFVGRGVFPDRLEEVRREMLELIQSDTDFRAAFANLGRAVDRREPVADTLAALWVDVFSVGGDGEPYVFTMKNTPLFQQERAFLSSTPNADQVLTHRLGASGQEDVPVPAVDPAPAPAEPSPEPAAMPMEPQPVYTGPPMPDNATMEQLPLGLEETAAPVIAVVSSGYGWREHPIQGGEKFHNGVDLAAPYGDPIGAFADGVVDYIGESPAYGQYLQIKHAGGVTSFYAHCSKLCVQPGQQVKLGETVAEVGDTGEVTGAHLHFELKLEGELLNPLYYIETE